MKKLLIACVPLLDIVLSPFVFLSALILLCVRKAGIHRMPISRGIFVYVGVFPIRDHYYEPLFDFKKLSRPLGDKRYLPGIDWNEKAQLDQLTRFNYTNEMSNLILQGDSFDFTLDNNSFKSGDAEYWYNVVRFFKPKTIIEIGSGNSTLVAIKAVNANKVERPGFTCRHVCIEPYEMPWLEKSGVHVIRQRLEDLDLKLFEQLEANDILFIDSSHIIRPQGDVLVEYLQILPILKPGVIVHVHDIFSPYDYPEDWLKERVLFWNEQYLLEAFLSGNKDWEIIGALNFLQHHHPLALKAKCPFITSDREPGSFYMRRVR